MYHYPQPQPGYIPYDYSTSPTSSPSTSPAPQYTYYIPPQYYATPSKGSKHKRNYSMNATTKPSGGWHSAEHPSPAYYAKYQDYKSPPSKYKEHATVPTGASARPKSSGQDDSRPRSSGHSRKPSSPRHSKSSKPSATPREATAKDALTHGIPAGYSLKNWDPEEAPVMLLGSVFDANSLGKWIYDWTVYHHGPNTPISEVAGDFWLLLIKLAHKMKRADECLPRVVDDEDYELVEEFLDAGDRCWERFKKLLKTCEEFMWKTTKKDGKSSSSIKMGKNAGCEFVDSIFGRDRELEETEALMQSFRLWIMRFDANCEDILRHPRG